MSKSRATNYTTLSFSLMFLERVVGFEPTLTAPKAKYHYTTALVYMIICKVIIRRVTVYGILFKLLMIEVGFYTHNSGVKSEVTLFYDTCIYFKERFDETNV